MDCHGGRQRAVIGVRVKNLVGTLALNVVICLGVYSLANAETARKPNKDDLTLSKTPSHGWIRLKEFKLSEAETTLFWQKMTSLKEDEFCAVDEDEKHFPVEFGTAFPYYREYANGRKEVREDYKEAIDPDNQALKDAFNALSQTERAAIQCYTTNSADPAKMNKLLATKRQVKKEELALSLASGLNKLPTRAGLTFRGRTRIAGTPEEVEAKVRADFPENGVFANHLFMSTSAEAVNQYTSGYVNLILLVQGKSGRDVSIFAMEPFEKEVLYLPGTQFRVKSVGHKDLEWIKKITGEKEAPENWGPGTWFVELEEI